MEQCHAERGECSCPARPQGRSCARARHSRCPPRPPHGSGQWGAPLPSVQSRPAQAPLLNSARHFPHEMAKCRTVHRLPGGVVTSRECGQAGRGREWSRAASPAASQAAWGQGLRLRPPAKVAVGTRHRPANRPSRSGELGPSRPSSLGGRANDVVAVGVPPTAPPLRVKSRALHGLHINRGDARLPPAPGRQRRSVASAR